MIESSRNRAADTLGVPLDAEGPAVRSLLLQSLPRYDFAPAEEWGAAASRLAIAKLPLTYEAADALVEYERADVREFAARYWGLSPDDRRDEWMALNGRCRDPEVRGTLAHLQTGLKVPVVPPRDEAVENVSQLVRELYLMAPRERAIRRLVR